MTVYILVLAISADGGLRALPQAFPDERSCTVAGDKFVKDMTQRYWQYASFSCLPLPKELPQ